MTLQAFRVIVFAVMETRNIFFNISPLDHRYSLSEEQLFNTLSSYVSEQAAIVSCAQAEIALVKAHLAVRSVLDKKTEHMLDEAVQNIDCSRVYEEEKKTKHSMRALVNVLKTMFPENIASFVHLGTTSVDILDTALAMRMRDCMQGAVLPVLRSLENELCTIAERDSDVPQIGRTHGQHAVPITFGFAVAP